MANAQPPADKNAMNPENFLPPALSWSGASEALIAGPKDPWITPSEKTGLTATPNYDETLAFLRKMDRQSALLRLEMHVARSLRQSRRHDFPGHPGVACGIVRVSPPPVKQDIRPGQQMQAPAHRSRHQAEDIDPRPPFLVQTGEPRTHHCARHPSAEQKGVERQVHGSGRKEGLPEHRANIGEREEPAGKTGAVRWCSPVSSLSIRPNPSPHAR